MSRYHLHRIDETGSWVCGGGYFTAADAERDAKSIIRTRKEKAGEKWKEIAPDPGFIKAWVNEKNHRLEIKDTGNG